VTTFLAQAGAPDGSDNLVAIVIATYAGSVEDGARAVQPIKEYGPPMLDMLGPIPYTAHQSMLDAGFPQGTQVYWKASFLRELSPEAMDVLAEQGAKLPLPTCAIVLEQFHGAVNRVPADATAFIERSSAFNVAIIGMWNEPGDADRCIAWARDTVSRLEPFSTGAVYVNYLGVGDDPDRVREAYGANYDRLAATKAKYDPNNLFSANQNIKPKAN
jgi:FAD/FMN-containing dehydrogenase